MSEYWGCAYTHPNEEPRAIRSLRQQNFKAFYPFFLDGIRVIPAFPGYIFFLVVDCYWAPVQYTRGVAGVLTYWSSDGKLPLSIPKDYMEGLRRYLKVENLSYLQPNHQNFEAGDEVRIVEGPFRDFKALVEMSSGDRVKVLLSLLGRENAVDVSSDILEKVA